MPAAIFNKGSAQGAYLTGGVYDLLGGDQIRPMDSFQRLPFLYHPSLLGTEGGYGTDKQSVVGSGGSKINRIPDVLKTLGLVKELYVSGTISIGLASLSLDDVLSRVLAGGATPGHTKIRESIQYGNGFNQSWQLFSSIVTDDGPDSESSLELSFEPRAGSRYDTDPGQFHGMFDIFINGSVKVDGDFTQQSSISRTFAYDAGTPSSAMTLTCMGTSFPMSEFVLTGDAGAISGSITITAHSWLDWE